MLTNQSSILWQVKAYNWKSQTNFKRILIQILPIDLQLFTGSRLTRVWLKKHCLELLWDPIDLSGVFQGRLIHLKEHFLWLRIWNPTEGMETDHKIKSILKLIDSKINIMNLLLELLRLLLTSQDTMVSFLEQISMNRLSSNPWE